MVPAVVDERQLSKVQFPAGCGTFVQFAAFSTASLWEIGVLVPQEPHTQSQLLPLQVQLQVRLVVVHPPFAPSTGTMSDTVTTSSSSCSCCIQASYTLGGKG